MLTFRSARPEDEDALYDICCLTGDSGEDATSLYGDGRMLGHIYAVPYLHHSPDAVFVAEADDGVCGYIVGTLDTHAYEEQLERDWWPALREKYPDPSGDPDLWDNDQKRSHFFHHPSRAPAWLVEQYPAHIHMNLLPKAQGKGAGTNLLSRWLDMARNKGIKAVHLGANAKNEKGMAFWQSRGFKRLTESEDGGPVWFGMRL